MAIEVFQGGSIPRELSSGTMEFLWAKWKTLNATNSLSFQRLMEESDLPVRANLTCLVQTGDDFVYMYVGKAVQEGTGFDTTGRRLSASKTPVGRDLLEVYRHTAQSGVPSFVRFAGSAGRGQIWQGLVLPIRLAPETVFLVAYSEQINLHSDVCAHLFQSAPEPMLIASPIVNDVGDVRDGWVIMMNDAARTLLDFHDGIGNLRLRQLAMLAGFEFGFKLHPPVPDGTRSTLKPAHGLGAEVIRFANAFVLRLHRQDRAGARESVLAPALAPVESIPF
ncbi:hypothetical protein X566_08850 [Afipia sp. P52-10]|uniref:hypothetical protein n=1 Tax=Afipia sp. P52-10 TaxID=1429916 RepID=UPI0003DEF4C3|nr:hypothetical protein [Afipia sp. P52-10]ETR77740.1 hypothetical protein X566_08850 [Afipia sp. P52-10]